MSVRPHVRKSYLLVFFVATAYVLFPSCFNCMLVPPPPSTYKMCSADVT